VDEVIDDNAIRLDSPIKPTLKVGLSGSSVDLAIRERDQTSFDIAEKLKKKLKKSIITDFGTRVSGRLVQGAGWAEVSEFQRWGFLQHRLPHPTAVIHTQTITDRGRRVDLCMFGSLENLRGFTVSEEDSVGGWTSSAAPMIEEFIALRGEQVGTRTMGAYQLDEEALAVEALKVAVSQGIYSHPDDHRGRPETRAYTIMGFDATEYVALIYKDVSLTASRWNLGADPDLEGASRILIGAPLWMRTTRHDTVRRYYGENRVVIPQRLFPSPAPAVGSASRHPTGQARPQTAPNESRGKN
jgi:hypothetical protein